MKIVDMQEEMARNFIEDLRRLCEDNMRFLGDRGIRELVVSPSLFYAIVQTMPYRNLFDGSPYKKVIIPTVDGEVIVRMDEKPTSYPQKAD